MFLKKIFFIFVISFFYSTYLLSNEIKIVCKVNNEIITNIDLENQIKYLMLFNNNLKNLSEFEILILAKNSLIKEIIKNEETNKYVNVKNKSVIGDNLLKQNYLNLGLNNKSEYFSFLKERGLELELVKKKLVIEQLWNTLIYEKFKDKVRINKDKIRQRIKLYKSKQEKIYEVNLSEILYEFKTEYEEVEKFINQYGFESAAMKYSISNTSSNGGNIGWINLNNLTDQIQENVLIIDIGKYTKPIKLSNGNLILKLNSKKEIKTNFNLDEETKRQILFEKNRQLNSFSLNYYKKLKQNTVINEY